VDIYKWRKSVRDNFDAAVCRGRPCREDAHLADIIAEGTHASRNGARVNTLTESVKDGVNVVEIVPRSTCRMIVRVGYGHAWEPPVVTAKRICEITSCSIDLALEVVSTDANVSLSKDEKLV